MNVLHDIFMSACYVVGILMMGLFGLAAIGALVALWTKKPK